MKISEIRLSNFKCIVDETIDLGKITFLTGANSSGKSSIIYSILGALQSNRFPLEYSLNGNLIRMGDFHEVVYGHDVKKDFGITIGTAKSNDDPFRVTTNWKNNSEISQPELHYFEFESSYSKLRVEKRGSYHITYSFDNELYEKKDSITPESIKNFLTSFRHFLNVYSTSNIIEFETGEVKDFEEFTKKLSEVKDKITFSVENLNDLESIGFIHGNFNFLLDLKRTLNLINELDESVNYISSFRLFPDRTYYQNTKNNLKVGKFGENYIDQISYWENKNDPKLGELVDILRSLSILENLQIKRLLGGRFEFSIQSKKEGVISALNDVGFGISQFLPILTADIQLGKGSTLMVSQPEIHLHPNIQAEFANYLVDSVRTKDKNYIIETHSEYLLNRIRLLIAKGEIASEDVKIHHLENDGNSAKIHEIKFSKDGQILGAPDDFFKTYMVDVLDIALNAVEN